MLKNIWEHNFRWLRSVSGLLILTFSAAAAGTPEPLVLGTAAPAPGLLENTVSPSVFRMIDPGKFSVGHALAFGIVTDGKRTVTNSLYANTLTYRLSAPLTLSLRWGISGVPAAGMRHTGTGSTVGILPPEFELTYRPSSNFMLRVQYSGAVTQNSVFPYRLSD